MLYIPKSLASNLVYMLLFFLLIKQLIVYIEPYLFNKN